MDAATLLNLYTHPVSDAILHDVKAAIRTLKSIPLDDQVNTLNEIKLALHEVSPFKGEPVDCVLWVGMDQVIANDYNPNSVAPPEMKLLERSINSDGFTQPIVAWEVDDLFEVIDGFHRNRVGRECESVRERIHGYFPLSIINQSREDRGDRIASTIRHNRARGKHQIESMSDIVLELKRRNWSPKKIGTELGMDQDEVLRLVQITGLAEMFADGEFSEAWEADILEEAEFFGTQTIQP
jgi:ParB-like chromosome segregation protein Spo0J